MNQQRPVETVEDFKLRIAAIIRGNPEQITGAPRPDPRLVRRNKRATSRKTNVERTASGCFLLWIDNAWRIAGSVANKEERD